MVRHSFCRETRIKCMCHIFLVAMVSTFSPLFKLSSTHPSPPYPRLSLCGLYIPALPASDGCVCSSCAFILIPRPLIPPAPPYYTYNAPNASKTIYLLAACLVQSKYTKHTTRHTSKQYILIVLLAIIHCAT